VVRRKAPGEFSQSTSGAGESRPRSRPRSIASVRFGLMRCGGMWSGFLGGTMVPEDLAIAHHLRHAVQRPDCLAEGAVRRELVSPC
jgi:hypothetical protein